MPEEIVKKAYVLYPESLTYNEIGELYDSNAAVRRAYIKGYTDALEFATKAVKAIKGIPYDSEN